MRKRTIAALITLIAFSSGIQAYDLEFQGLFYDIDFNSKTMTVVHPYYNVNFKRPYCSGRITIPSSIKFGDNDYKVTAIGENAFNNCSDIISITIPNTIKNIGYNAFSNCSSLSSVNIPESVSEIDNSAFSYCENIDTLIWDNDNVVFSDWLFKGLPSLKHVIIGKIKTDYRPFAYCDSLISAEIIDGTTYIPEELFSGCSSLTSIRIPESVTSIGEWAFDGCSSLTSIAIPKSVTRIEAYTFDHCTNLSSVELNENLSFIGARAFAFTGLTEINIPAHVDSIGILNVDDTCYIYNPFSGCHNLRSITVDSKNKTYDSRNNCNAIIETASNTLLASSYNTSVTIPESVTAIGNEVFYGFSDLTSIVIHDKISKIGTRVFSGCSSLTTIQVDPNNTVYDSRENCNAIIETKSNKLILGCKTTTIPETVTDINELAFNGIEWGEDEPEGVLYMNDLLYGYKGTMPQGTHIKVREGTKRIASSAFSGCTGLTSIIIPESVTSIGSDAFNGCTGLKSVTIPGSVTTIEPFVFEGCSNLASVYFQDGVNRIEISAFYGCYNIKTISIPESVSYLDRMAFYSDIDSLFWNSPNISPSVIKNNYDWSLKYVSIGSKVVQIEESAFYNCYNLDSVFISDGVKVIGDKAFSRCGRLKSIKIPQSVTSIGNSAFSSCYTLTSISIPESVTSIGDGAFQNCSGLTSIIIPESVTSIGDGAFFGCNAFPEGVLYINDILYSYIGQMPQDTSITVRDGTTRIAGGAFSGCYLKSITIPESVTSIGDRAFGPIDTLYWDNTYYDYYDFSYNKIVFGDNYIKHRGLKFARGTEWYNSLPDGPVYLDNWLVGYKGIIPDNTQIDIKEGTIGIATQAFYSYEDSEDEGTITSVTIPESVTTIEHGAFSGCGISAITIPKSVTSIGEGPFYNCPYLTTICVDPDNSVYDSRDNCNAIIETASNTLIQGCSNTTIPENVTSIGTEAFSNCTNLTSIVIPDGVTTIGDYAFSNCDNLTSVTLPQGLESIKSNAFLNCTNLTSINIPQSVTTIEAFAFSGCYNLKDINIPSSVKSIDRSAFSGCIGLSSIPDGLTYIGDYAFAGCTGITYVTIPEDITYIGHNAFMDCSGIKTVSLPASMGGKEYEWFFQYCSDIESIYLHSSSPIRYYDFYNIDFDNCILYVPAGSKEIYRGYSPWSNFKNIRLLDECNIDGICYEITSDIDKTVSVVHHNYQGSVIIPSTVIINGVEYDVTGIASEAFSECDELVSVTIPQSVTEIEQGSFEGCHALTEIIFKGSPIINKDVFIDCPNIEKVVSTNITPGTMRLYNPFIAGDSETVIKDHKNKFDVNAHYREELGRFASSIYFTQADPHIIISSDRIPAGSYRISIGIVPSPDSLLNTFHPIVNAYIDDIKTVLLDSIEEKLVEFRPGMYRTVRSPQQLINDITSYDSVLITDNLIIPDSCNRIEIWLVSGVNNANYQSYSKKLLLDRIFFEPIGNDFPQESYCGPFTESVFNNATLYVPESAVSTYREADGWKLFKNIAIDTKVEPVHMDNRDSTDNPVIYDMLGRKIMSDSLERLQPGLYIINGKKYLKSHM